MTKVLSTRDKLLIAAKYVNYEVNLVMQRERDAFMGNEEGGLWVSGVSSWWNPLENSGQAFDLMIDAKLISSEIDTLLSNNQEIDRKKATREAIVEVIVERSINAKTN